MPTTTKYEIAYIGLKPGIHHFEYLIDKHFFNQYGYDFPYNENIIVNLQFEKNNDQLFNLLFTITGNLSIDCDRCLASLQYPIQEQYQVIVKMLSRLPNNIAPKQRPDEELDLDIIYITPDATHINIAQLLYEFVLLSIPQHVAFPEDEFGKPTCPAKPDGSMPCNKNVLAILDQEEQEKNNQADHTDQQQNTDPRWDALRFLK